MEQLKCQDNQLSNKNGHWGVPSGPQVMKPPEIMGKSLAECFFLDMVIGGKY